MQGLFKENFGSHEFVSVKSREKKDVVVHQDTSMRHAQGPSIRNQSYDKGKKFLDNISYDVLDIDADVIHENKEL